MGKVCQRHTLWDILAMYSRKHTCVKYAPFVLGLFSIEFLFRSIWILNTHLRGDMLPRLGSSETDDDGDDHDGTSMICEDNTTRTIKIGNGNGAAKFVYITRSPLDTCVSFYHHLSHQDWGSVQKITGEFLSAVDGWRASVRVVGRSYPFLRALGCSRRSFSAALRRHDTWSTRMRKRVGRAIFGFDLLLIDAVTLAKP